MYRCYFSVFISLIFFQLQAEQHKIQIMMTVPRTISTAFERAMIERGDHKVFHEPWNSEYIYRNQLGGAPPAEILQAGGYLGVKELFYRYSLQRPVYVKDMIWAIKDEILNDEALLSDPNVVLSILIRDPALSIESFFIKISENLSLDKAIEITRWVFRYDALVLLAEKYQQIRGEWPILVDAEQLCVNPAVVMQNYCQRAGICYIPEALTWGKKMPEDWEHFMRWHLKAAESEGFLMPINKVNERFSSVPEAYVPLLEEIYQEQMPHYEKLEHIKRLLSQDLTGNRV